MRLGVVRITQVHWEGAIYDAASGVLVVLLDRACRSVPHCSERANSCVRIVGKARREGRVACESLQHLIAGLKVSPQAPHALRCVPGTDSRIGFGFKFGPLADAQVLVELGPQKATQELTIITTTAQPDLGKRHVFGRPHDDPFLQDHADGLRADLDENHIRGRAVRG